ncbi:MAG: polyprenyl synthetase family protein [Verrucomicrobiia bacterium]
MAVSTVNIPRAISPAHKLADLFAPIRTDLARVEEALIEQAHSFDPRIGEYVRHALSGKGKRLRPALVLLAGGATGRIGGKHLNLAAIIELIHAATLVHDDVLDEAQLRHGQPTSNAHWGNEITVLLGDCLFANALRLAATHLPADACRKLSETTTTICSGEILQTQKRFDPEMTVEQYLDIIHMKTGSLFGLSCELGAHLNAAPPLTVKIMREFGVNFGMAYQIYDDCVDIFGQEREAGKSLGTDMKKGKLTLPWLLLLQHIGAGQNDEIAELLFHGSSQERARLLALVAGNGVMSESHAMIQQFLARAEENLTQAPANDFTRSMSALAGHFAEQSRALLAPAVVGVAA